jgi:large subunit ribosomal protein L15
MKLHELKTSHARKQRIGRGGKRGTTAGRGTKGQHSRSGHRIRPAERDLLIRLPKLRGFRNKPKSDTVKVFNLGQLATILKSFTKGNAPIDLNKDFLVAAGLLGKKFGGIIKILGTGDITTAVVVNGIEVSASAKTKIEKAGGTVATSK